MPTRTPRPPEAAPQESIVHRQKTNGVNDKTLIAIGEEIFLVSMGRWPNGMGLGASCEVSLWGGQMVTGKLIYFGGSENCHLTPRHVALRIASRGPATNALAILRKSQHCQDVSQDRFFRELIK